MSSSSRRQRDVKLDERLDRQQAAGRRVALWVTAAILAALLGPFVAWVLVD